MLGAFDDAGNLYETENRGGAILKFTPDGTQTTFASGLSFPTLLAFAPVPQKVLNVSARGFVLREDNALIAGFILGGNTLNNNKVIVRAIGPSLTGLGVTNALQDPTVEVRDARGALVAANDNWQETQETDLAASNLAPGHANESAVLIALPAGSYTAILRGAGGTIGIGLIEIYSAL